MQSGERPAAFAGAKINLSLRVVGQRDDGYHLLESLVVHAADVGDTLSCRESPMQPRYSWQANTATACRATCDNLVLRAARLLSPDRTVRLTLRQGTSDRVRHRRRFCRCCRMPAPAERVLDAGQRSRRAESLVRNCSEPMFPCASILSPPFVTGIGEGIEPVGMPALHLVLVNPGVEVSTPAVFAQRHGPFTASYQFPTSFDELSSDVAVPRERGWGMICPMPATEIAAGHREMRMQSLPPLRLPSRCHVRFRSDLFRVVPHAHQCRAGRNRHRQGSSRMVGARRNDTRKRIMNKIDTSRPFIPVDIAVLTVSDSRRWKMTGPVTCWYRG